MNLVLTRKTLDDGRYFLLRAQILELNQIFLSSTTCMIRRPQLAPPGLRLMHSLQLDQ